MELILKNFNLLTTKELFNIYALRNEVFIVEQNCIYQDIDKIDLVAQHLLVLEDNNLIAYARIIPPGISYKEPAIGRVVVKKEFRAKAFGKLLMQQCINLTQKEYKNRDIVISAQTYLIRFYNGLGFDVEGKEYLEDEIPHTKMRLKTSDLNLD